jgi:hypothetical protein
MAVNFVADMVRLGNTVANLADAPTDPTTLTVIVDPPTGVSTSKTWPTDAEVVKVSTGVFYYDYTIAESGTHEVRWVATGTIVKAKQTAFVVAAVNATT